MTSPYASNSLRRVSHIKRSVRGPPGRARRAGTPRGVGSIVWCSLIIRVGDIYGTNRPPFVETLQQLTHRQVEALQVIAARQNDGRGARLKDIASGLRVRSPSALAHLGPLEELGLISRFRGKSRLTDKGARTLQEYQRHHRVAETLFGHLGLNPEATCAAAHEIDLAISHRTVDEICRVQQHPTECPHGAPIAPCRPSARGHEREHGPHVRRARE